MIYMFSRVEYARGNGLAYSHLSITYYYIILMFHIKSKEHISLQLGTYIHSV